MNKKTFHAKGKLLLTGEYFVLDGALALALPTQLGQRLTIEKNDSPKLHWQSFDHEEKEWFSASFHPNSLEFSEASDLPTAERLQQIFRAIRQQQPTFFQDKGGLKVATHLEFPRDWGLGSSSTLLYLLATWAEVDVYQLLDATFGGSGYDLACAGADSAIFYQKKEGSPSFSSITFDPVFKDKLYFVYLGKKQNSRSGIARYREKVRNNTVLLQEISQISKQIQTTTSFSDFTQLLLQHEQIVAQTVELPRAQDLYFADFSGIIKSLGAWGGDFVLSASNLAKEEIKTYFKQKGFPTILAYEEMIL